MNAIRAAAEAVALAPSCRRRVAARRDVLHSHLHFLQGGVKFPTGGESPRTPQRGRSGETPEPTVTVRTGEGRSVARHASVRRRHIPAIDDPCFGAPSSSPSWVAAPLSPNPIVGCVLVQGRRDRRARDSTRTPAAPHAEVVALAAGRTGCRCGCHRVRDARAVQSPRQDPAVHRGARSPRRVAGVVVGMADPNPIVGRRWCRRGCARPGSRSTSSPTPSRSVIQNEAWLHLLAHRRPFVRVKTALTLDGHAHRSRTVNAARITGEGGAGASTMRLRAAADAVVVGASDRGDRRSRAHRSRSDGPLGRHASRFVWSWDALSVPAATLSRAMARVRRWPSSSRRLGTIAPDGVEVRGDTTRPTRVLRGA